MDCTHCRAFIEVLNKELVPALGCTEPIAVAYAAAKAREVLGRMPEHADIKCSGNIIKNVKGVKVPNSNGMIGIGAAAVLGIVGGRADKELEVLTEVTEDHIAETKRLLKEGFITTSLAEDVDNLYIELTVTAGEESAKVVIVNRHTLITEIEKNGEIIYSQSIEHEQDETDWKSWSIAAIVDFANYVDIDVVKDTLRRQIQMNTEIAEEGLKTPYGAQIGRLLLETEGDSLRTRARARAAAGSDARMGGCALPVVINSGSGNQGVTVSMPLVEYAKDHQISEERLYRSLIVSNLVSVYQKHFIGSLSSFCGAVTAASGAGAGIAYMLGGSYEEICHTIINTVANVGGIICDGAKSSCAAKIASAVEAAIMGYEQSIRGLSFAPQEGIVMDDIEDTIRSMGYIGRVGMAATDKTVLNIMIGKIKP